MTKKKKIRKQNNKRRGTGGSLSSGLLGRQQCGNNANISACSSPRADEGVHHTVEGVDREGRMRENQGRRFYGLLTVLANIAVKRLNEDRRKCIPTCQPLKWNTLNAGANSIETRELVMSYVLQEIDWLVDQVESGRHNSMIQQCLGRRRLSEGDKREIRSWRVHVKDDFFVLDHIPNQGTVMVQVGRLQHIDHKKTMAPHLIRGDYHQPRVFVVQGLADPLSSLMAFPRDIFRSNHPSLLKQYPEYSNSLCVVHTALLPYNGGITYMSVMKPTGQSSHYHTPQDWAAAMARASQAYKLTFPSRLPLHEENSKEKSKSDDDASKESPVVALYRTLDPEKDAEICRLASDFKNQGFPVATSSSDPSKFEKDRAQEGMNSMVVKQILWYPHEDRRHPHFDYMMDRATNTGPRASGDDDKVPYVLEGIKNGFAQEILVNDSDPCPFHRQYSQNCASFGECCKKKYLKRALKAEQTANPMLVHLMYNPITKPEVERIGASTNPAKPFNCMPHVRIGYQDMGMVRLKVPPLLTHLIRDRMDTCDLFHSCLEYKWIYWGYIPLKMPEMGVMAFGDVTLFPDTGIFEANGMTAERVKALILEMKHVCSGIPILEATLEMQPSHKAKPDKDALEENKALLQEGLDCEVHVSIDKEVNIGIRVQCGFCGLHEEKGAKLLECACKCEFYCCKDHQRLHWKDHKEHCSRLRGLSGD